MMVSALDFIAQAPAAAVPGMWRTAAMKVSLDTDSCCGVGYCARVAPEIFEVVDDKVTLREGADLSAVEPERLTRAAAACPWRAIQVSN
jgi:ferredoxin